MPEAAGSTLHGRAAPPIDSAEARDAGELEALDAESLAREFRSRVDALPSPKVPRVRPIRREFSRRISSARPQQLLDLAKRS